MSRHTYGPLQSHISSVSLYGDIRLESGRANTELQVHIQRIICLEQSCPPVVKPLVVVIPPQISLVENVVHGCIRARFVSTCDGVGVLSNSLLYADVLYIC